MKPRSKSSGKSEVSATVPPRKEMPTPSHPGETGPEHVEQPQLPIAPPPKDERTSLAHLMEQLTLEPGATLMIAHPLTPERQRQLAEILLSDARKEAAATVHKLQQELSDIDQRLQERMADLARLNEDLENVLAGVDYPVIIVGRSLNIKRFSPGAERLLNMSPGDLGQPLMDERLPVHIPDLHEVVLRAMAMGETAEKEIQGDPGRWYKIHVSPYRTGTGAIDGAVVSLLDIGTEKQNEALLRSYQAQERRLHEVARGVLVVLNVQGTVMMINPSGCEMLGYSEMEMIGTNWFEMIVAKSQSVVARTVFDRTIKGEVTGEHEYPLLTKDGTERVVSWKCAILRDYADSISGVIWSGEDRSALKEAKAASESSEQRFRLLMESVQEDEFFTTDQEGYVVNWAARPDPGKSYRAEEMVGEHFSRLFVPEDFQAGKPMRVLESAETGGRYEEEGWRLRKDGSRMRARTIIMPIRNEAGKMVGFSHATQYRSGQSGKKDSLESTFTSLHGFALRPGGQ